MKYLLILLFIGLMWAQDYDPETGEYILKNYNPNTGEKIILNDSLKVLARSMAAKYLKDSISADSIAISNWTYFGALSLPLSIMGSKMFPNILFDKTQKNSDLSRITAFIGTCLGLGFPHLINKIYLEEIYYPSSDMNPKEKSLYNTYYLKQIKKFNSDKIFLGQLTCLITSGILFAVIDSARPK